MIVGLLDVDSHNFPNLPLMKISAYHKTLGDSVEFVQSGHNYDQVYISKIFSESKEPNIPFTADIIHRGGSGYDLKNHLPLILNTPTPIILYTQGLILRLVG